MFEFYLQFKELLTLNFIALLAVETGNTLLLSKCHTLSFLKDQVFDWLESICYVRQSNWNIFFSTSVSLSVLIADRCILTAKIRFVGTSEWIKSDQAVLSTKFQLSIRRVVVFGVGMIFF